MRRVMKPRGVCDVVSPVPAGRCEGWSSGVVAAGDRYGSQRSQARPSRWSESQPRVVHAKHRGGACPQTIRPAKSLSVCRDKHAAAALAHVASGDYAGEHWLASFAVFLLSTNS